MMLLIICFGLVASPVVVDDTDLWGIREQLGKQTVALRPLEKVQPIVTYGKALRGNAQSQRDLFAVFEFARADIQFKTPLKSGDKFISKLNVEKQGIKYLFHQKIYQKKNVIEKMKNLNLTR